MFMSKKNKLKKFLSLLLALIIVIGAILPSIPYADAKDTNELLKPAENVFIQLNGENVDSVKMDMNEKLTLTIHTEMQGDLKYKWDILVDADKNQWAAIYDCESVSINLSYGMLVNCLDENNLAQIRATVISGEDVYIGEKVLVEVCENVNPNLSTNLSSMLSLKDVTATSYSVVATSENEVLSPRMENADHTVTLTINYFKDTGEKVCPL